MDGTLEAVAKNLQRNNYAVHTVAGREDVVPLLEKLIPAGAAVAVGGSATLRECGVLELLRAGSYRFWDRYEEGLTDGQLEDVFHASKKADVFLCSSNAVVCDGTLYNVDGHSNRISAIVHGPRAVIMVVGSNKLVPTLADAVERVKRITAPRICRRANKNTPCRAMGECVSIKNAPGDMAAGCDSPERRCCHYLVSGRQRVKGRITIILVQEPLGY